MYSPHGPPYQVERRRGSVADTPGPDLSASSLMKSNSSPDGVTSAGRQAFSSHPAGRFPGRGGSPGLPRAGEGSGRRGQRRSRPGTRHHRRSASPPRTPPPRRSDARPTGPRLAVLTRDLLRGASTTPSASRTPRGPSRVRSRRRVPAPYSHPPVAQPQGSLTARAGERKIPLFLEKERRFPSHPIVSTTPIRRKDPPRSNGKRSTIS